MNKRELVRALAIATVGLLGPFVSASIVLAGDTGAGDQSVNADPFPSTGPVPRPNCGPRDRTESGLQGQTTPEERFSGDSKGGYNCNLELVAQYQGEGAFSQDGPAYFGDCAYYGTDRVTSLQQHLGVRVIDASDPRHPRVSTYLNDTAAARAPHETVAVHAERKLLVVGENNGPNFAVYDLSADCRHPVLKSSIDLPGSQGHMGAFAPDGLTYWLTNAGANFGEFLYSVDLTDPSNPVMLPPWQFGEIGRPHEVQVNPAGFLLGVPEGTRLYAGQLDSPPNVAGGLVIMDVSDYQFRLPNPEIRIISNLFWDGSGAEPMVPVKINGHPYIIASDESGAAGGVDFWAGACARGVPPFGFPRIIDVGDETNPKIIAELMLEVSDPANCSALLAETPPDFPGTAPGTNLPAESGTTNYSEERCVADNPDDAKMLACSFQHGGLRVFDIRDLSHPKEIAYWKPPAVRTDFLPAAGSWAQGVDRTVDKIAGWARWRKHGRELHLWTVSDGNGFQVLRFTDHFKARHKNLFESSDD